jgi:hypothetical protein
MWRKYFSEAEVRKTFSFWPTFHFKEKCGLLGAGRQESMRPSHVFEHHFD